MHQAKKGRESVALLHIDEEKGAGKAGNEFSWSINVMERGRPGEEVGTVGSEEIFIAGISL